MEIVIQMPSRPSFKEIEDCLDATLGFQLKFLHNPPYLCLIFIFPRSNKFIYLATWIMISDSSLV